MLFNLMLVVLLCTGCVPTKGYEPDSAEETASDSIADSVAAGGDSTAQESGEVDEPLIISGDLTAVDWGSLVGRTVTVRGDLVVVDTYDLIRRGQIKVARHRIYVPTNRIDPNDADPEGTTSKGGSNVAKVTEMQKNNDKATLILDDGSAKENVFPPTLFPKLGKTLPTVRVGSVINGVSGKLVKAGSNLLLVPNAPLRWQPAERPQRPDVGNADVTVSSFNVLNYFTTIDDGGNNARGADSTSELKRQEAKLVSAMIALQADVIGLMEIENNLAAENRLVAALNQKIGKEVFKGCGLPDEFRETPGGKDSIRVGMIYRVDRVVPLGEVAMIRNDSFKVARTPMVQRFKPIEGGRSFAVIVNHFKSKGSSSRADEADKNKGDGQGAYNATRRTQSLAICNYVAKLKQTKQETRVLVIGDLNAYGQEDPIDAMRGKGLVDLRQHLSEQHVSGKHLEHYSFIYYGQCGSLDHAMATESLATDVTGIATWHINADEPRCLDYNQEFNPETLYVADPFRSSDHDPVIVGIRK